MNKFAIISDSSCDLNKQYREEKGIDYAKTTFSWTDEKGNHETYASLDWDVVSSREFYDILRRGIRIYTSQVTIQNYLETFKPHLDKGEDILYLACSSGLSASIQTARMIVETELKEQYPDRRIVIVDTLRAGMSQGMIVQLAVSLKEQGKSLDEVTEIVEQEKLKYLEIGIPETLSYLKRAGRVSAPAAYFGNIVSLKPILVFDEKGSNKALEKAIGRKAAYKKMAEFIAQTIDDPENQVVYLMHADCKQIDIDGFKNAVLSAVKVKDVVVELLGPVIGASSGPGTIILNYKGK